MCLKIMIPKSKCLNFEKKRSKIRLWCLTVGSVQHSFIILILHHCILLEVFFNSNTLCSINKTKDKTKQKKNKISEQANKLGQQLNVLMQVSQYLYSAASIQKVLVKCDTKRPNSVFHTVEMIKVEILQFLPDRV